MSEPVPTYHELLADLDRDLVERGALGLLVLDASSLAVIEDQYGAEAYEEVRQRVFKLLDGAAGEGLPRGDLLRLDRPRGLRFIFFLERKRRRNVPFSLDRPPRRPRPPPRAPWSRTSPGPPSPT